MTVSHTFGKNERLHHKAEFQRIFDHGRRLNHPWLGMVVLCSTGSGRRRLGIIVGRKYGNSVRRHRIKRLLREVFRLNKHHLSPGTDVLLLPRKDAVIADFHKLKDILVGFWKRAGVWECEA